MIVRIKDLHKTLQSALDSVNYRRPDISVEGSAETSMFVGGGAGQRGFAILVDMDTGKRETHWGSWGGANMFSPRNAVDLDTNSYPLPPNGAVITGSKGQSVHAHIVVHPDLIPKFLPQQNVELTQEEKDALYCHRGIKGGPYRQEELRRRRVSEECIKSLIKRGMLKENKAGARQITTEGKNAIEGYYGH